MSKETCYMCEAQATSKEHAPPKCLFPEEKYLSGADNQRVGLITVPACDKHNTQKSGDDEYLMYLFSMLSANQYGRIVFSNKVVRSAERRPKLAHKIFENSVTIGKKEAYEVDRDRVDTSIAYVARALFFHETKMKWCRPIHVNSLVYQVADEQDGISIDRDDVISNRVDFSCKISALLQGAQWAGANPDVFKYKFHFEAPSFLVMSFCFFGEINFEIISHPDLWELEFGV